MVVLTVTFHVYRFEFGLQKKTAEIKGVTSQSSFEVVALICAVLLVL